MNSNIAVYPGSFDPITLGHLDIIRRASGMFKKLIVVVMINPDKHYLFSAKERVELIKKSIPGIENIEVMAYDGLLADFMREQNAKAIIKGLRAMSDFEYEFQMALANKKLNPDIETLFMITSAENMYLSSSMVKQIASLHGNIKDFVPNEILNEITKKLKK